jgi:hypothetical protein
MSASGHRFWRSAALIFGVMVLINYFPVFSGKVPFPRDLVVRHSAWKGQPQEQLPELIDIVAMFYPFRALLERGANEHVLPLWNPYIMSGAPFQANAQSAVFAPLNVLYYALPLKAAWTVNLIVNLFLAAIFMALFVQSIGASSTGAIVSGMLFAFCGFMVTWQGMGNGDSCIWLPLMCYAVHRLHLKPSGRAIAIAGFAFAMPVLSGHPETAAHSALAASALAVFLGFSNLARGGSKVLLPSGEGGAAKREPDRANPQEKPRMKARFSQAFVLSALLGFALSAVQTIPTLEWFRQLGLKVEAPQPVLDQHQGQGLFSRDITRNPSSAGLWIPEASAYVGMLGLLAAPLALFHRSRRYACFLLALAAASAIVAYGVQPFRWVIEHLPILKAMKNGRLTLIVDFALAALAGLGISAIGEQFSEITPQVRRRAMTLLAVAFIVASLGIVEVHRATLTSVDLSRGPLASFLFLTAALAAMGLRIRGNLKPQPFSVLICGLAGLEMLSFSYGYTRFAAPQDVFDSAPAIDFIRTRDQSAPFRVAKDRVPIPHDAGMIYGFESADGYDLTTERARAFNADFMENREDGVMLLAENILVAKDRRFDMLNVKYLMVSKPGPQFDMLSASERFTRVFSQDLVAVFENKTSLPRFFLVPESGIEVIPEMSAQLSRLKDVSFDPENRVIVAEPRVNAGANPSTGPLNGRVQVRDRGMNGYGLRVESSESAVLVVSQTYYPGWKATVDGSATPVYPVDVALTGIVIPAGAHEVRLYFQPTSFRIGMVISLLSVGVIGLLIVRTSSVAS